MEKKEIELNFEEKLEQLRSDFESGFKYFIIYSGIHKLAFKNESIRSSLNSSILFWRTCLDSLLSSTFICLGRIFDNESNHNLSKFIKAVEKKVEFCAEKSSCCREGDKSDEQANALETTMQTTYKLTLQDYRNMKKEAKRIRKIYQEHYKKVRDKIHAHNDMPYPDNSLDLLSKEDEMNIRRIFNYLFELYFDMWMLHKNGMNPNDQHMSNAFLVETYLSQEIERVLLLVTSACSHE